MYFEDIRIYRDQKNMTNRLNNCEQANIDKVFELLDIEKAVDVNTLSGWIMEELGQIPKEGDSFVSDGVKVVVLKMDDHRVDKAKVYRNVQNNAENEGNQEK